MFCVGLDMGSRFSKAVIIDDTGAVRSFAIARTKPPFNQCAQHVVMQALQGAALDWPDLDYVVTTGFARYAVPFRQLQITDVTAAARGALELYPKTRTVLDIGFQSTRAIRVQPPGRVEQFKSNEKCAAGAGGFVERTARYLEVSLEEIGALSLKATAPVPISSVCAVLAESEIINHISDNQSVENIVRGVHRSLATRALGLARRIGVEPELTLVGGMARQAGMVHALQELFRTRVNVPNNPQLVQALGAAHVGLRRAKARAQ